MTQLSIPAPCSEKWTDMTPVRPDCRFCVACERQIVDFTTKSDAEILEHLKRNSGKICGRFHQSQLNRPIQTKRAIRRGSLTAAAASIAALLSAQQPAGNQPVPQTVVEQTPDYPHPATPGRAGQPENTAAQDSVRTISGKLTDGENGEPLIGCSIWLPGTTLGAVSNPDGQFFLKIPLQLLQNQPVRLKISYTGYMEKEIELPARIQYEDLSLLPVEMEGDEAFESSGLVGITVYTPTLPRRVRNFFYRLFH